MAIKCGFFDSINKDRLYPAEDMNQPYKMLISNGVFATPKGTPSDYLQVYGGNGMTITVKEGRGLFGDKWFLSDSDISFVIENNHHIIPRIDTVIVRIDTTLQGRKGDILVLKGTPEETPKAPEINTVENIMEYRLADIYVAPSATELTQDVITDRRGSAECPWVTSLIQQVDTSTLYIQWETAFYMWFEQIKKAFDSQMEEMQNRFDKWFETVKDSIASSAFIRSHESTYVAQSDNTTVIPIGISQYKRDIDILQVYINGLKLTQEQEFEITSDTQITLKNGINQNTPVNIVVFQSVESESKT